MKKLLLAVLVLALAISLIPNQAVYGFQPAGDLDTTPDPPPEENPTGILSESVFLPLLYNGPQPFPIEGNIYGVETTTLLTNGYVESMAEAGARWVRRNGIYWNEAEPAQGQINWQSNTITKMENELTEGYRDGIEPIVIIRNTPSWAQQVSGSDCGPIRQDKMDDFGNFMNQIVAHFSAEPYNVKYWELGNEPDVAVHYEDWPFGCWGDPNDPYFGGRYYAEMLKQAYPRIKSADPDAQVLLGGLLLDCDPNNPPDGKDCLSSRFLEGVLVGGGGNYFDGVSYHAYDFYSGSLGQYGNSNWHARWNTTGPILTQKTPYLKNLLANHGEGDKFLVLSEVSLLCDYDCNDNFEHTKANYLAQAYAMANYLNLEASIWYDVQGGWRNGGLIKSGTPLPAYYAFQFSHQQTFGASTIQDISDGWLHGYEFQFPNRTVWIIWSRDGVGRNYTLPETPTKIFDRYGNQQTAQVNVYVDWEVLYIEWLE